MNSASCSYTCLTRVVRLSLAVATATLACSAQAEILIPTNQNGADAEVRESETGTPTPIYPGVNRGTSFELATRLKDSTSNSGDRSSADYLKFDISGLTAADLTANPYAALRLRVGAPNINGSRQIAPSPADPNQMVEMTFALRGLTNFALGNWDENTITYYNAPGITPDATQAPNPVNPGEYDFNSDMPQLGTFKLPTVGVQNHLAVGSPVYYTEAADGPLHQLILDALSAGQTSVTLVVHHGLDGFLAATGESPGTTPTSMLNFNYLFIPKDITVIDNSTGDNNLNDTGYDADTTDPNNPLGSPYLHASNATGVFSPTLILGTTLVPEPSSVVLLVLGGMVAAATRRKHK
jgi:hypothetical protein